MYTQYCIYMLKVNSALNHLQQILAATLFSLGFSMAVGDIRVQALEGATSLKSNCSTQGHPFFSAKY